MNNKHGFWATVICIALAAVFLIGNVWFDLPYAVAKLFWTTLIVAIAFIGAGVAYSTWFGPKDKEPS